MSMLTVPTAAPGRPAATAAGSSASPGAAAGFGATLTGAVRSLEAESATDGGSGEAKTPESSSNVSLSSGFAAGAAVAAEFASLLGLVGTAGLACSATLAGAGQGGTEPAEATLSASDASLGETSPNSAVPTDPALLADLVNAGLVDVAPPASELPQREQDAEISEAEIGPIAEDADVDSVAPLAAASAATTAAAVAAAATAARVANASESSTPNSRALPDSAAATVSAAPAPAPGAAAAATATTAPAPTPVVASETAAPAATTAPAPTTAPATTATSATTATAQTSTPDSLPTVAPLGSAPLTATPTAVPAAASAPAPAPVPQDFSTQLAKPIAALRGAAGGEHVLTVNVTPENLGPVTVRAHIGADGMRIELISPSEAGREALKAILGDLRRDLAGLGITTGPLTASGTSQQGLGQSGQGTQTTLDLAQGQAGQQQASATPRANDQRAATAATDLGDSRGIHPLDGAAPMGIDVLA